MFFPSTPSFHRIRQTLLLTFSVAGAALSYSQQASDAPLPADLQAELDSLLKPGWQITGSAKLFGGYRDNVLLSAFAPEGRGFVGGEFESLAWRPPQAGWEWLAFVNGDLRRYVSPIPGANGEQQWFAQGDARWSPLNWMRLGLAIQGYYQDMVLDLSETEAHRVTAELKARGAMATVSARLLLPLHLTLEPSAQEHLSDYLDYPGDYHELKTGTRLEWKRWDAFSLSATWYHHHRGYKERTEFTAGGRALPGTRLTFTQEEYELRASSTFTAAGKWTLSGTAGEMTNRDGASGYFDYDRRQAKLAVAWAAGPWTLTTEATHQHFNYLVQRVGIGIAPPPRKADNDDVLLRAERRFHEHWLAFAESRWERNRSNEAEFSYRSTTVLGGISREF